MRKALMLAAASALVLSACQPANEDQTLYSDNAAAVEIIEPVPAADASQRAADDSQAYGPARLQERSAPQSLRPEPLAPVASIAYAFSFLLSAPRDRGAELMSRHEFACVSAGPGYCQVVTASADWTASNPGGRLEMRGQPEWINRFRAGLALDAQNAGGRLEAAVTEGEDVTRGMDEAATGAKTTATLAERIRELQRRSGGTMAQRLEIERQLADLQRQYDQQQIALRDLNGRVQSARLTVEYREGGVMASDSPTRPVAKALQNAFGLSMGMLAFLITAGSVTLPIAVIGGAVWWATVRRRRKVPVAA